ncbi:MAG TPA: NAD(P)-binding domain-containing protein [Alphaproteobacteria bacterium]|nr:NAD(P)-binding domain-containing protein [Alphaproteobacteria bacterium]
MKIGVLGTGPVGNAIGGKLVALGHDVVMGARQADNPKAVAFAERTGGKAAAFREAAAHGELVFNCLRGDVALDVLTAVSPELEHKILVDVSNPLDFSRGAPPTLAINNTDSLGEVIQRGLPGTRVVKTLNTVNSAIMVNPGLIHGPHAVFVSGNDAAAKGKVKDILRAFGWQQIIDLGDIGSARGPEQYLPLWLRLLQNLGTAEFNIAVVKREG